MSPATSEPDGQPQNLLEDFAPAEPSRRFGIAKDQT